MSTIRCYDKDGSIIDELYQWDKNVKVTISDIDTSNVSELHFCNRKSEVALRVAADKTGNSISAYIPRDLLCQPESIVIFICESLSDGEIRTTHVCRIPIHPRPKASDSYYEDDTQDGEGGSGGSSDFEPDSGPASIDGAVMYNSVQVLTEEQKVIARGNIGAASDSDVMDVSIYDPRGMAQDIFAYIDGRVGTAVEEVIAALPIYRGEVVTE